MAILLSLLLVLASLALLVLGLAQGSQTLIWASIGASLAAAAFLVIAVIRRRREDGVPEAGVPENAVRRDAVPEDTVRRDGVPEDTVGRDVVPDDGVGEDVVRRGEPEPLGDQSAGP